MFRGASGMGIVFCGRAGERIDLALPDHLASELHSRLASARVLMSDARLADLIANRLVALLAEVAIADARPPSPAQVRFAMDISAKLGIPVPEDALRERAAMGRFLTAYGDYTRSGTRPPETSSAPVYKASHTPAENRELTIEFLRSAHLVALEDDAIIALLGESADYLRGLREGRTFIIRGSESEARVHVWIETYVRLLRTHGSAEDVRIWLHTHQETAGYAPAELLRAPGGLNLLASLSRARRSDRRGCRPAAGTVSGSSAPRSNEDVGRSHD